MKKKCFKNLNVFLDPESRKYECDYMEKIWKYEFNEIINNNELDDLNLNSTEKNYLDAFFQNNREQIENNLDKNDFINLIKEVKSTQNKIEKELQKELSPEFYNKLENSWNNQYIKSTVFDNIINNLWNYYIYKSDFDLEDISTIIDNILNIYKAVNKEYNNNKENDNYDFQYHAISTLHTFFIDWWYEYNKSIDNFKIEWKDNFLINKASNFTKLDDIIWWKYFIDYQEPLKEEYAKQYINKNNFPEFNNEKLSFTPNEIYALTMIFSWQEADVKDIEWSNFNNLLKRISSKFDNITFNWDIKDFKKDIISIIYTKEDLSFIENDEQYKAFLEINKNTSYSYIWVLTAWINYIHIAKNEDNSKINNEAITYINEFFEENIRTNEDNSKFIDNFNILFWKYWLEKKQEDVENLKKEKTINYIWMLRGIENIESSQYDKMLENIKPSEREVVKKHLENIFDNIKDLNTEYIKSWIWDLKLFLNNYFENSELTTDSEFTSKSIYDNIIENEDKKYKDEKYDDFIEGFISILTTNIDKKEIQKSYEVANSNEKFNNYIDKAFENFSSTSIDKSIDENKEVSLEDFKNEEVKNILKANFKASLIESLSWKGKDIIDKKFIEENKTYIMKELDEDFNAFNWNVESSQSLFENFIDNFPEEWFRFDNEELSSFYEQTEKLRKETDKIEKMWYAWYAEYYEKQRAERELLEQTWWLSKENISLKDSVFAWKESNDVQTSHSFEWWVHTFQFKLPWSEEVLKIQSLKCEDGNKELMKEYLKWWLGMELELKWDTDHFNKLITESTDFSKEWLSSLDFKELNSFLQIYIYKNFYENKWEKERKFMEENNLNIYDMYNNPKMFFKEFSSSMNKDMWWIKSTFWTFEIELNTLWNDYFNKNNAINIEQEVLDNWKWAYKNEEKTLTEKTLNMFSKWFEYFIPNKQSK